MFAFVDPRCVRLVSVSMLQFDERQTHTLPPFITPNPATNSGDGAGIQSAFSKFRLFDGFYADALDPTNGEFLMPLVGVLDDPFAMV